MQTFSLFFSKLWKNHSCSKRRGKRARGEEALKKVRFKQNKTKKSVNAEANSQSRMHKSRQRTCRESQSDFAPLASCTHSLFYPNNYLCLSNTPSSLSPIIFPWKACHWCDSLRASWSLPTNDNVTVRHNSKICLQWCSSLHFSLGGWCDVMCLWLLIKMYK